MKLHLVGHLASRLCGGRRDTVFSFGFSVSKNGGHFGFPFVQPAKGALKETHIQFWVVRREAFARPSIGINTAIPTAKHTDALPEEGVCFICTLVCSSVQSRPISSLVSLGPLVQLPANISRCWALF